MYSDAVNDRNSARFNRVSYVNLADFLEIRSRTYYYINACNVFIKKNMNYAIMSCTGPNKAAQAHERPAR